jgi:hypothetical protein
MPKYTQSYFRSAHVWWWRRSARTRPNDFKGLGEIAYVFAAHDLSAIHAGFCGGVREMFELAFEWFSGSVRTRQKGR